MDNKDFVTVQETAEMLGITPTSVYIAFSEGRLDYVEVFGRKVISRADVDAYQRRTRADGNKPKGRPKGSTNRKKDVSGEAEANK